MNNNIKYHKFRNERKRGEYIRDKLIQSAVNGDIDEYIELSGMIKDHKDEPYLYYSLKHERYEMIEYLLGKITFDNEHNFMNLFTQSRNYNKNLKTDTLLSIVNTIDNEDNNTKLLSKHRKQIVKHFVSRCYMKNHGALLTKALSLVRSDKQRQHLLKEYTPMILSKNTKAGLQMKEDFNIWMRDQDINRILDI